MTAQAKRQPKLGLCPIGKFVFSHEDAVRQKQALQDKLRGWGVDFVDLDGVLPDGLIRDQKHVEPAVKHLRGQGADALFLPHCNFGTEGAAAMVARHLGLPTLLWGPRDGAPQADGSRLRDTLCGMFATSKVLRKLGVPFTYIENCHLDDAAFTNGFSTFLRAAHAANAFRQGIRIGHLGQRIDFFWTTIINESELLERFKVEVLPLDLVTFISHVNDRAAKGRGGYAAEVAKWRREAVVEHFADDTPFIRILAMRDQLLALAGEHNLDAFATQDFPSLTDAMETYDFFTVSLVSETLPVGVESDIHGAISGVLAKRATLANCVPYLADITVRHPTDDNGVLLWHAGAPLSLKHPESQLRLGKHWILPSPLAGMPHFRMREGGITIVRFDGDRGEYQLAIGQGASMPGPDTLNNYVWMKVDNWPRWERILMEGPFIHHAAMVYDHIGDALVEACKYIPGLAPVRLDQPVR